MKRYHRFVSHEERAFPVFFFVACFVFGTLLLFGAFIFFNKRVSNSVAPSQLTQESDPPAPMIVETPPASVDVDEYWRTVREDLATFFTAANTATGGWVDAPHWEERIREKARVQALERAGSDLERALSVLHVPGDARAHHLALVVAVDDLLLAVRQDRSDLLEAAFLRIDELHTLIYNK